MVAVVPLSISIDPVWGVDCSYRKSSLASIPDLRARVMSLAISEIYAWYA